MGTETYCFVDRVQCGLKYFMNDLLYINFRLDHVHVSHRDLIVNLNRTHCEECSFGSCLSIHKTFPHKYLMSKQYSTLHQHGLCESGRYILHTFAHTVHN